MADRPRTYPCGTCLEGLGWVTVDQRSQTTMAPCRSCRPELWARWKSGHLHKTGCWHRTPAGAIIWDCDDCRQLVSNGLRSVS